MTVKIISNGVLDILVLGYRYKIWRVITAKINI